MWSFVGTDEGVFLTLSHKRKKEGAKKEKRDLQVELVGTTRRGVGARRPRRGWDD